MEFKEIVQNKFTEAGWTPNRKVNIEYISTTSFNEFPEFLKLFLINYGNLIISDAKTYESDVVNKLILTSEYLGFEKKEDYLIYYNLFGKILFSFGKFEPDGFRIACDIDGKVYMIGDNYYIIGNNLKEGIENLITDNWDSVLEFDEINEIWFSKNT